MKTKLFLLVSFFLFGSFPHENVLSQLRNTSKSTVKCDKMEYFFFEEKSIASEIIAYYEGKIIAQAIVVDVKKNCIIVKEAYVNSSGDKYYVGTLKFNFDGDLIEVEKIRGKKSPRLFKTWPVTEIKL